jgi:hypothetical protein
MRASVHERRAGRGRREPGLGVVIRLGEALQVDPVLLVRMTLSRLKRAHDA